jgi:ABC-type oligopeptide transport system ATPase subunit
MAAMNEPALIEVEDLHLSLPDMSRKPLFGPAPRIEILRGVSFRIEAGAVIGIVGESGSGKTTLGRALLRLNRPTGGAIRFEGRDIAHSIGPDLLPVRRAMQIIFQDPYSSLNPRKTVLAIVAEPVLAAGVAATRAEARDAAIAALADVALGEGFLDRYPHQLSGGQRQRVGIARAVALKPRFILADEIVSGLDVSTQAQVLDMLMRLKRDRGLTIAFISHDLAVVRRLCDRVIVLKSGRIVEDRPVADLFATPRDPYTAGLIAAIPSPRIEPGWLEERAA